MNINDIVKISINALAKAAIKNGATRKYAFKQAKKWRVWCKIEPRINK